METQYLEEASVAHLDLEAHSEVEEVMDAQ